MLSGWGKPPRPGQRWSMQPLTTTTGHSRPLALWAVSSTTPSSMGSMVATSSEAPESRSTSR